MIDNVTGFFAKDGPLADVLSGYRVRQEQLDLSVAIEDAIAKIYSVHGQLLINKIVSNNSQIDISHLKPAYYFISFKTIDNSKIVWKKIIVQ